MPVFRGPSTAKERRPGIPTTDPLGACWGCPYVGGYLGHGPADNRGHVRSFPDSSIPVSTWRNAGCQPVLIEWFFFSHGRGHRFKPCRAHQAQRLHRSAAQRRLSADCQQITPCDC